jgi:hypothetical protein
MLSENVYSSNVGSRSNTDPTYDDSTMVTTTKGKTLTVFMTTPWRSCTAAMSVQEVILIIHMIIQP